MSAPTPQSIRDSLIDELEIILARPLQKGDERRPLNEIGVDSISLVELLVQIEKTYGLSLVNEGLAAGDFRTIERLSDVIHARLT